MATTTKLLAVLLIVKLASSHPVGDNTQLDFEHCPDQTTQCAKDHTCCNIGGGVFGCCPTTNGVCCNDSKHCCPEGYTCNILTKTCVVKDIRPSTISACNSNEALNTEEVQVVKCPDNVSLCNNDHTCCKLKGHEGYGCCEGIRSVCCKDEIHCCPENTTCDDSKGMCNKKISSIKTYRSDHNQLFSPLSIVCPDGKTTCPDQNTCCELVTGSYGCCPHPEASCCFDKMYCCPHGYTCDPNSEKCKHSETTTLAFIKTLALEPIKLKRICGDDTICGSNDTCCKHPDDSWACCPSVNAVCCSDGTHCCPQNYTCDMVDNTCKQNTLYNMLDIQRKQSVGMEEFGLDDLL